MGLDAGNGIRKCYLLLAIPADSVTNRDKFFPAAAPVDTPNKAIKSTGERHGSVHFEGFGFRMGSRYNTARDRGNGPKIGRQETKKLLNPFLASRPQFGIRNSNAQVEGSGPSVGTL